MDIGYLGAFGGGVLSLLSPCSVILLPAFFAYAFTSAGRLLSRTGLFFLGLVATLIPLGIFSGIFGSLLGENRTVLITVVAIAVIVIGALQLLGVPIPGMSRREHGTQDATSALSVFLLGTVYAVAGVCTGPILGSVLMVASLGGSALYGAVLLTVYAVGMVVPLLALAGLWHLVGSRAGRWLRPRMLRVGRWQNSWTSIITGMLTIGLGVLLLATDGTAGLGGLIGIDEQFRLESGIGRLTGAVPDSWFAVAAVLILAGVSAIAVLRRRRSRSSDGDAVSPTVVADAAERKPET